MFIHTTTGEYPVTFEQLQAEFPQTLFPQGFNEPFENYMPVQPTQIPEHDAATHKAIEDSPVVRDGQYKQAWKVQPLSTEEMQASRRARVPAKVSRRQARQALLLAGLLDTVQPAINAIADPVVRQFALIDWQDATDFERHNPTVMKIGLALGLGEEGLDKLFIAAAAL